MRNQVEQAANTPAHNRVVDADVLQVFTDI